MRRAGIFPAIIGAAMLMVAELGARAGLWSSFTAVLLGVLGGLLGVVGLARLIRARQAEATATANAQAAAQAAAAAQRKQEVDEILKKY